MSAQRPDAKLMARGVVGAGGLLSPLRMIGADVVGIEPHVERPDLEAAAGDGALDALAQRGHRASAQCAC